MLCWPELHALQHQPQMLSQMGITCSKHRQRGIHCIQPKPLYCETKGTSGNIRELQKRALRTLKPLLACWVWDVRGQVPRGKRRTQISEQWHTRKRSKTRPELPHSEAINPCLIYFLGTIFFSVERCSPYSARTQLLEAVGPEPCPHFSAGNGHGPITLRAQRGVASSPKLSDRERSSRPRSRRGGFERPYEGSLYRGGLISPRILQLGIDRL